MSMATDFPDRPLYEKLRLFISYALKRKDIREFIGRIGFILFIILWLSIAIIISYLYDIETAAIIFIMAFILCVFVLFSIIVLSILCVIYEEIRDYVLDIIKSMKYARNEANYHEE